VMLAVDGGSRDSTGGESVAAKQYNIVKGPEWVDRIC